MSFTVKIILLESAPSFSKPAEAKTQCFVHLSFHSTLQLINGIAIDLQKILRYFDGRSIVAFFRIEVFPPATVFSKYLALKLRDLKLSLSY